jgi:hypothetical protein
MRVNVDSQVATDPRWRHFAELIGASLPQCVGMAVFVWFPCYDRTCSTLLKREVDICAQHAGFADAMVASHLAEEVDVHSVRILGVEERIKWLTKQRDNGKRGGRASAGKRKKREPFTTNSKPQGPEQQASRPTTTGPQGPLSGASSLSLALAPDLSPAPAPAPAAALIARACRASPKAELVRPCCTPHGDRSSDVEFRFCALHREHLGMPYVHKYGRDRKELKELPADYDRNTLMDLVEQFFQSQDQFVFEKRGASIPAFVSKIPALLAARRKGDGLAGFLALGDEES